MKVPAGLLGAGLLLWGHQTGLLVVAAALAALLEGARFTPRKWDLTRAQFCRVADFSELVFAGVTVLLFVKGRSPTVLQWLPLCLYPMIAAQAWSVSGRTDLSALFWSLRAGAKSDDPRAVTDLSFAYFATAVLGAGVAHTAGPAFYVGTAALAAWALWSVRRPGRPWAWMGIVMVCAAAGWAGQAGLQRLQLRLEVAATGLVFGMPGAGMDSFRSRTAIGDIGTLKFSDQVVLRVWPEGGTPPALLREAGYNRYLAGAWVAQGAPFEEVAAPADGRTWELAPEPGRVAEVRIAGFLDAGKGLLPLPGGAFRVLGIAAAAVRRNPLGGVHVQGGPGLASYRVGYERVGRTQLDGEPGRFDLAVPKEEEALLRRLAAELRLDKRRPREAARKAAAFFRDGFKYSLTLKPPPSGATPLQDFLTRTRSGHCEYFATATALLLRAGGIPTRYAAGYSIQEYSRLEKAFVARRRHAHSWALVFMDGTWRDFDTTPVDWAEEEARSGAWLRPARDLWAWLRHKFSAWRWRESAPGGPQATWLVPLAFLGALWWLWFGLRRARSRGAAAPAPPPVWPGLDSEFYEVERLLSSRGLGREPSEASADWARRVGGSIPADAAESLAGILALHNRLRFDPSGLSAEERRALRDESRALRSKLREPAGR